MLRTRRIVEIIADGPDFDQFEGPSMQANPGLPKKNRATRTQPYQQYRHQKQGQGQRQYQQTYDYVEYAFGKPMVVG